MTEYSMIEKEKYKSFCNNTYVPIYSKSWWLDAICFPENWGIWLYEVGNSILAAMPYYSIRRDGYNIITKPPLTQNNGILFAYPNDIKPIGKLELEEKVINAACEYINELHLDVYEQQFQTTFTNWLPFFWNYYDGIIRYTYVFTKERLVNMERVWNEVDKKKRNKIKKGNSLCEIKEGLAPDIFYEQVERTFAKQELHCPFSKDLWFRLYEATMDNNAGKIIYAVNEKREIVSTIFLVWDEERMYQLISGGDVELQHYEGKSALVWHAVNECARRGLTYDFEGSVIKRISKSNRLFGAEPVQYFRIRKVFNPEILRREMEEKMNNIAKIGGGV